MTALGIAGQTLLASLPHAGHESSQNRQKQFPAIDLSLSVVRKSHVGSRWSPPNRNSFFRQRPVRMKSQHSRPSANARQIPRELARTSDNRLLPRRDCLLTAQSTSATKACVTAHQYRERRRFQTADRLRQRPPEDRVPFVRCRSLGPQSQFASSDRTSS